MGLETYQKKRNFSKSPEPQASLRRSKGNLRFVVQRHQASKLHYDFRLEMEGVLKSWAVPKGPSLNPSDKRLAVEVEDHPLEYASFEGDIPEGSYGAGHVDIWDEGIYHALDTEDPRESEKHFLEGLKEGSLSFVLKGDKLEGAFSLVSMKGRQKDAWLLIKKDDEAAVHTAYDSEDYIEDIQQSKKEAPKAAKASAPVRNKQKSSSPRLPAPMMAKLTDAPFDDENWIFEIKWDGYRALAELSEAQATLYSRNGKSFGNRYQPILDSLRQLKKNAVLDGEIVVLDEKGHASFQELQNYQNNPKEQLFYFVFDLLSLDGRDLRELPLLERKKLLRSLLAEELPAIRYSDHVQARGCDFFKVARHRKIEGIMAKKADSPYRSGKRSSEWLKIKTSLRQEAVIGGYTEPKGKRKHLGALLLGVYEKGKLVYVGQSGSGFNSKSLKMLKEKLDPLEQKTSPFQNSPKSNGSVHWVQPSLIAEISFAEWTDEGIMRQAIFKGLREDKNASEVVRESSLHTNMAVEEASAASSANTPAEAKARKSASGTKKAGQKRVEREIAGQAVSLSNLQKLYWPKEGITKGELIDYYQSIADILLPYLQDRPESLLRHPNGIAKAGFFQKDIAHTPDWVRTEKILAESTGEKVEYLVCDNAAMLAYMNNLGCIQLNPWNSRLANPDKPDYLVLDLDPARNSMDEVVEVALAAKEVLDKAGAASFCKTSGATGLHIYVPLQARYSFDQARMFAQLIAQLVHERLPKLTSLERNPKDRPKQVYLDYLQNSIGQTLASVYSVRPRPGATVSTPLEWAEVKPGLSPAAYTLHNIPDRISQKGDLFKGVLGKGIDLEKCLKKLE